MKRTKAQRVLAAACGPALGVLLAVPVGGLLAGAAGADSSCYTGCSTTATTVMTTTSATRRLTAGDRGSDELDPPAPAGWPSPELTSKRWRSSVWPRSAWVPCSVRSRRRTA